MREEFMRGRNAGMSALPGMRVDLVTPSRALACSLVHSRSLPLAGVSLLLLLLGILTAQGQVPKDAPPPPAMENGRPRASAVDKITARKSMAMDYYKRGDLAHAREQFESIHASMPRDVSVAELLAYVYVK